MRNVFLLSLVVSGLWILPTELRASVTPAPSTNAVVGTLPYSNQWLFELPSNYLYFNVDQLKLAQSGLTTGHFRSDYGSTDLRMVSVDFFARLVRFSPMLEAPTRKLSWLRHFSLWGRYRLGYGGKVSTLSDTQLEENLPAEKTSLGILFGQIGVLLTYEALPWFQPFLGFEYTPFWYRNSSSMPSAEVQGQSAYYGPALGAHFPVLFNHHVSLLAEVHQTVPLSNSDQIFDRGLQSDFGLGLVF